MTDIRDQLRTRLADYDGRAVTLLGETEAALGGKAGYLDALIALAGDDEAHVSSGATWLLKSALENGCEFSAVQVAALCESLANIAIWDAQLHVCQSIQYLFISEECAKQLADWLEPLLSHDRPFLRAWSLDALYRVSQQHRGHAAAFASALAVAEQDGAASVRARARKLV